MENLKKNKLLYIGVCIFIMMICIIVCCTIDNNDKNNDYSYLEAQENSIENISSKSEDKEENIYVHITGEVINPGVIIAKDGDRIKDIVEKAGGFTEKANTEKLNLAYKVCDGQKINIPNINDNNEDGSNNYILDGSGENIIEESQEASRKININMATQSELESLTGIGPSTAAKIIEYRKSNGKFKDIEEIKNVSGIGDEKYKKIQNEIEVR